MKKLLAVVVMLVIVMVMLVPTMIVGIGQPGGKSGMIGKSKNEDIVIHVYLHEQDKIVAMGLEEYVKGVVAAEMPAEFEPEALKVQALCARTYAIKQMKVFGGSGLADHPGADVSSDYRQSQAWQDQNALRARWGPFKYDLYWSKISKAVEETRGEIIAYQGEPINALFHSTSGSKTASAKEVWGFDYPYLQSVACQWDTASPRYSETKTLALSEAEERLGIDAGAVTASQGGDGAAVRILSLTDSGRVEQIRLGTQTFSGLDIRSKLELRSTNFSAQLQGDQLVIQTTGYGHGVGLCQYGANGLAKEGRNYRFIINHYYTGGVEVKNISGA